MLITSAMFMICFSGCKRAANAQNCCEGFTGKPTDPRAEKLVNTCHFIGSDSIAAWTARYQENTTRTRGDNDTLRGLVPRPGLNNLLGDSTSFNSCIVKKILCNENCIGLRAIYGMSPDRKIHIILVGIKPDYGTLYIPEPEECCGPDGSKKVRGAQFGPGATGGAEYGQMPSSL